jgi:hypothetical protein
VKETPVIAFLIPFASHRVKSNWELACAHLRQTLRSIQNSTNGNFRVVVAGHEAPDFDVALDPRFVFLPLDHAIPSRKNDEVALKQDKLTKIAAAWDYAKATWRPDYVMKLDADDLISSRLVAWLATAGGEAGYLIKQGWYWYSNSRYLILSTGDFDRECGSCLIISSDIADQEGPFLTAVEGVRLDEEATKFAASDLYSLVPGSGTSTLLLNDTHQRYAAQLAYLGHQISTIPFRAMIYRASNPESITGITIGWQRMFTLRMLIGRMRRTRLITPRLRREFMLES